MAYGLIVIVVRPQRPAIDHLHFFLNSVDSSSTGEALVTVKLFTRLGYTIETTACDDFATHRARTGYIVRPLSDLPLDSIAVGLILMAGDPDGLATDVILTDLATAVLRLFGPPSHLPSAALRALILPSTALLAFGAICVASRAISSSAK